MARSRQAKTKPTILIVSFNPIKVNTMRHYTKTIDTSGWSNDQFSTLHRGQWVSNFGATGQFLGITARGTVTINYKQTKDLRKQYAANQPLRRFVLLHGGE